MSFALSNSLTFNPWYLIFDPWSLILELWFLILAGILAVELCFEQISSAKVRRRCVIVDYSISALISAAFLLTFLASTFQVCLKTKTIDYLKKQIQLTVWGWDKQASFTWGIIIILFLKVLLWSVLISKRLKLQIPDWSQIKVYKIFFNLRPIWYL